MALCSKEPEHHRETFELFTLKSPCAFELYPRSKSHPAAGSRSGTARWTCRWNSWPRRPSPRCEASPAEPRCARDGTAQHSWGAERVVGRRSSECWHTAWGHREDERRPKAAVVNRPARCEWSGHSRWLSYDELKAAQLPGNKNPKLCMMWNQHCGFDVIYDNLVVVQSGCYPVLADQADLQRGRDTDCWV